MRFEEAFDLWQQRSLTQEESAQLLGVCERSFRRYIDRYEDEVLQGLMDKRMEQVSHRRAPVDEVLRLESLYRDRYRGWNVKHFYERYQEEHRKRRDPSPIVGLMVHQDASTHERGGPTFLNSIFVSISGFTASVMPPGPPLL